MTSPTPPKPADKPVESKPDEKPAGSSTADVSVADKAEAQMTEGVTFDHGEKSDTAKEQEKQAEKADKDPYGATPMQSRDLKEEDAPKGRSVLVDGIAPHTQEFAEGEEIVGGTLPPV